MRSLCLLVLVGACGSDDPPPRREVRAPPPPIASPVVDRALDELEALRAKLCACHDRACADAVQTELRAWRAPLAEQFAAHPPTPEQDQRGVAITRAITACQARFEPSATP
ncbi:MAG TPA: hypothetical protein VFQ53_16935 [Kofleriaceae bacterium]|nr:hypothetical protein [Kofleriaceae bacterium]